MFLQCLGETFAAFHPRADVPDHITHYFVRGLVGQRLKRLHDGDAGIHHGGQLAGEHDQVGQRHLAAFGLALLADFFLDGQHQQVSVEQSGDGGLLRGRLD